MARQLVPPLVPRLVRRDRLLEGEAPIWSGEQDGSEMSLDSEPS